MLHRVTMAVCLLASSHALFLTPTLRPALATAARTVPRNIAMAIDYKDPLVAKEFASIQGLDLDDITDELAAAGLVAPATMNDMDIRIMLVEVRMRKAGTMGGPKKKPTRPAKFGSEFERILFDKPAVRALYEKLQAAKDVNAMNLVSEHLNNPKRAKDRYAGTPNYAATIAQVEEAMAARIVQEVTTPTVIYSGFPSNMGENGVKMTLAVFGEVADFTAEESDDGMTMGGRVTYEDVAAAKAAIDKYDGVDMGLGTTLELQAL
jgi:hypothetical protein